MSLFSRKIACRCNGYSAKPLPNRSYNISSARFKSAGGTPREVPPFSIQSLQKNTKVVESAISERGVSGKSQSKFFTLDIVFVCTVQTLVSIQGNQPLLQPRVTSFKMYYDRGDLPIKMEYLTGGDKIGWTVSCFSNLNTLFMSFVTMTWVIGLSNSIFVQIRTELFI